MGNVIIRIILNVGIFCLAFMVLDRSLSLIYGFNFQPYGEYAPPGFTYWGHIANGSAVALAFYLVFKVYDYGKRNDNLFLKILPFIIYFIIGGLIPYFNDASHLEKHGMAHTLPLYIAGNDLYLFLFGVLVYKVARSVVLKIVLLLAMFAAFLAIHFLLYAPAFPEFYWG